MNDYDRETVENIRNDISVWMDDLDIGDEVRNLIHDLYQMVDDFITDLSLEVE